jgi:hypothetical protein
MEQLLCAKEPKLHQPNIHVVNRCHLFIHQTVTFANTIPNVLTIRGGNVACCRLFRQRVRYR